MINVADREVLFYRFQFNEVSKITSFLLKTIINLGVVNLSISSVFRKVGTIF